MPPPTQSSGTVATPAQIDVEHRLRLLVEEIASVVGASSNLSERRLNDTQQRRQIGDRQMPRVYRDLQKLRIGVGTALSGH